MSVKQTDTAATAGGMPATSVRPSQPSDLAALREIYNYYVENSHATFDLQPKSKDERRAWLASFATPAHRCLSAVDTQGQVVGYACSGEFKAKPAYASSVEVSVYLHPNIVAKGVGQQLYNHLLPLIDAAGVHRAYAGIALPNPRSLRLHQQHGFTEIGHLSEAGFKFDRYWDVVWLQRPNPTTQPKPPQ